MFGIVISMNISPAAQSSARSTLLLIARVSVGFMFLSGAFAKIGGVVGFGEFFATLGIPIPGVAAFVIAWLELIAGVLLLVGLGTRVAAGLLAATMIVASALVTFPALVSKHADAFAIFSGYFYAPEWLLLIILAGLVLVGAGRFSLDALLQPALSARRASGPVS
jgi:putative oxidoreductase